MKYTFEIVSATQGLGSVDIELNDREVQIIKEMIKDVGEFNLADLEQYDTKLFNKILDAGNNVAEDAIKQTHKEFAESCGEEFDEDNFEVDWQNEYVDILCPEDFMSEK